MGIYAWLPKILNMSLTASVTILVILLARLLLGRAPKIFSYVLWGVVLFRLLCPITISSPLSLLRIFDTAATEAGSMEYIPSNLAYADWEDRNLPGEGAGTGDTSKETVSIQNAEKTGADSVKLYVMIGTYVWFCGMVLLFLYSAISLFRLHRRMIGAVCIRNRIYEADYVMSPFVIGILRPRIYLPVTLTEKERDYILLHERTHIRRGDHVVKLLFFLALVIHWFNPLVWLAFRLMEKDMEMSCDEAVMKRMEGDIRAEYSQSLLGLATGEKRIAGTPLAFGERDTKARIKNVMRYQKPALLVLVLAIVAVVALVLTLGSNPRKDSIEDENTVILKNPGAGADTEEQQEGASLVQELESQQAAVQQEIESFQEEIEQLQIQYESAKDDGADTEKQQELERRMEELEEQKAALQQKLVRLQEERGQMQEENGELQEQYMQQYQLAENWAKAFCDRDGEAILSISSESLQESLQEEQLLVAGDGFSSFGWSSPWPWASEKDYRIVRVTENSAEILFYAWVSDPHITVWGEKLTFRNEENGKMLVNAASLEELDYICEGDTYARAYPDGITGTRMDYLVNGAGEALNQNALSNRDSQFYAKLFEPESAAVYLLNLLDNPNKVEVTAGSVRDDGSVPVTIHFMETIYDDVTVDMIQPYGEEGIWIPHTKTS